MNLVFSHLLKFTIPLARLILSAVSLAALCVVAQAQDSASLTHHTHIGGGAKVGASNAGYNGPQAGLWLTGEAGRAKFRIAFDLDVLAAEKQQAGTGTARLTKFDLSARYFLKASVFVSGELEAANLTTDLYGKSAVSVGAGAGYRHKNLTVSARYLAPDSSENGQQGVRVRVEPVWSVSENTAIKLQADFEKTWFKYQDLSRGFAPVQSLSAVNASLGIALVRRF